jgi:CRISPR-associated protein Csx17
MAIDWKSWTGDLAPRAATGQSPDDAWWVVRLATLPWAIRDSCDVPVDPAIPRRLASGDGAAAFALARQRLAAHGLHPAARGVLLDAAAARRWAAALVFPITRVAAQRAADRIQPQTTGATHG